MTRQKTWLISMAVGAVVAAVLAYLFWPATQDPSTQPVQASLVRPHSPVLGAAHAPVTVVEFFDPSCEACRAFHPFVKRLLLDHDGKVRVVIRYAPFHKGSDEAVAILEAAREQGRYEAVLSALLERQPEWAAHGAPDLALAWQIATEAGLDTSPERRQSATARARIVLEQDVADLNTLGIEKTPTFFVNGQPLARFHPDELRAQVERELKAQR
ncbi:disulfide bond formation protein DsbA [Caenimonas sedimenti]|uniref:Disulfide bond formation protein DsbA n=1 Tax=Caenimonas sedimenti TaxID=2596921 RepID=A0A562ZHK0_9BURK|nr:thioredoxin domain-containing protein [Caenimonas sedimenti]TWO67993.1 disulfide bond formation protein DsbA [Caenimonas sedimenti]